MDGYNTDFAAFYDLVLYGENSHEADGQEIAFMDEIFAGSDRRVNTVLDAGCGTGRFLVPLARCGYQMTGIDKSPRMIEQTAEKLKREGLQADLISMGLEEIKSRELFDAVICVDSVLCYLIDRKKIQGCCTKMAQALKKGGVFVMETWNIFANARLLNRENAYINKDGERRADIHEKNTFDEKTGVLTIMLDVKAKYQEKTYNLNHSESLRIFGFDEMKEILENSGLKDIKMYSGYDFSEASIIKGDSMIYTGVKR
ncbi:MAG: hypothetical protein CVV21_10690 [Candidatus Goldiibacteriota bacterium HGW-Goldbacteria-1]|jgi:2-polyprenyl-3-methyl-5-hydroxy-6-metoxy-1,4-benzoquinol methylase|nr:MAG: hypothetical protein CVV21_10690 [Candidatus Goldiibacteriota bacterium HGW-Goldbacteria-1]